MKCSKYIVIVTQVTLTLNLTGKREQKLCLFSFLVPEK